MEEFLLVISIFAAAVRMATPILFAVLGELFAERSGILNLGLEGTMILGAFAGFMGTFYTGNIWFGVLAGIMTGMLLGLLMGVMSIRLRLNQAVAGIAITLFGLGLSTFLFRVVFGIFLIPPTIERFKPIQIPLLCQIPVIGPIFFQHNLLVYIVLLMVPVSSIILFKTTIGLKIRSVGENPRAADSLGVNVYNVRYLCIILCGALAGLGGAYLPLAELGVFTEGMSAGRGWIAIAIVIFGKWVPSRILLGTILFSTIDSLQLRLQAVGFAIPYQFLVMLPYVITIVIIAAAYKRAGAPSALTIPYEKG